MYKLYRKNPENFAFAWIGIYCLVQSLGNGISAQIGIQKSANAVLALVQSVYMLWWLYKNGLMEEFQLKKPARRSKNLIFYLPLILISTSNLWLGIRMNLSSTALFFHVLLMLSVGFLEELIFRGFLFEALRKKNLKTAVVVSALTFGAGHIINFFNGRGMSFKAVLLQIVYAVLIGFLLVMIYLYSQSMIPCILAHQTINILSAFANHQASQKCRLAGNIIEIVLILLYLAVIIKAVSADNSGQYKDS